MKVSKAIEQKIPPYTYAICTSASGLDIENIVEVVFDHYKFNQQKAYVKYVPREISDAVQVVMYLAYICTELSQKQIANSLNRDDRTTVTHAIKKIKGLMQVDKDYRKEINELHIKVHGLNKVVGKK